MKAVEQGEPFTLFHGHTMRVVPVGPCTFRIRLKRAGGAFAEPPLLRYGILREPENRCPYEQVEDDEAITIATTQAELRIDRRDGQWSLCDGQRGELLRTAAAPSVGRSGGFELCCTLDEGETVYGLGNAAEERMQLRGSKVEIRLDPKVSSAPIPYVMSSRGWAILMNTTWAHTFDIGSAIHDVMTVAGEHGELDFYLFCGSGYGELLDRYTEIAGKPRLLPIWAYGLTYIRDILTNDREVLDDVLKFRQEDIPCDMVGLGRGWTETDQDGSTHKKWHPGRFSIPSGHIDNSYTFTDTLRRNGFKLCLLMHCFGYDLTEYEERKMKPAEEAGDAAGEHPERWYDHFRTFAAEGVAAFRFTSFSRIEPTPGRSWANGMNDDELANLYPVLLGKQVHEGYAEQTGKRPFIHTVAGYTGNQQFTAMESGKYNSRGGAVLRALNLGVSGHAHVASHINIDIREGIHCGFLQPWAFINSGSHFRNPCVIEKPLREMFRKYARLRYRLIPYLYATAHSAARTGMPIARAMPLLFPEDPQCADLQRQYMLGDYLLVGAYINSVYLPEGRWIDFWTGATCEGGQTITCAVPDDAGGPLFIREGAILPMWPEMDYIEKSSVERMELHVYPGQADSQFTLYEDDGETFGYLHGRLAVTVVRCEAGASHITIRIAPREGTYDGMPAKRLFELWVTTGSKPARIRLNDEPLPEQKLRGKSGALSGWQYDRLSGKVRLVLTEAEGGVEIAIMRGAEGRKHSRKADYRQQPASAPPVGESGGAVRTAALSAQHEATGWKRLLLALESGRDEAIRQALESWWDEGVHQASMDGDWRLHLFNGCSLLIHYADRRGWKAAEVFGRDMETIYMLQTVRSPEQGYALLQRLAQQIARRSRPVEADKPTLHPVVREVLAIVERELDQKLSLQQLAQRTNVHPFYLSRLFKQQVGEPFSSYVLKHRMNRARAMLMSGLKVYEAAAACGFRDVSHFSRMFAKYWGAPPETFKP